MRTNWKFMNFSKYNESNRGKEGRREEARQAGILWDMLNDT